MALKNCCLIGRGKVNLRVAGDATLPFLHIGNVETLNLAVADNEISIQDFTQAGNVKDCSVREITAVTLNALMRCFTPTNLALATYGNVGAVSGVAVSNESVTAKALGSFIPLSKLPDLNVAPNVTNVAGSTTYVAGTDYTMGNGGIYILEGSSIPLDTAFYVDYTAVAASTVEFFTNSGKEYEIIFDGVNQASSLPFFVHLYRVRFGTAKQLDFISKDFAQLDVSGEVLKSATIVGNDTTSAYGHMRIQ